ncbi:ATP synthase F1 subunit delta [Sphingorhabdus lutea]|uniref:ATP synthase subunit delta n=1 Tax=Sphingorhabdus lutea TaxID=1913578 RepID=A0A1L3JD22_9SPHN|nr:F0F1 ATP synthase subunit delta [Sphingorhabdus lutea]APG63028.1 ATP synthase F1 subunit delta [Sphingorhabdus lutea]
MEHSGGISASLAGRYATALFELAGDSKTVASIEKDLTALKAAVSESMSLKILMTDPKITRESAQKAVSALAVKMKLHRLTQNTLGVLAQNRRLASLTDMANAFSILAARQRGEISAEVISAHPLTKGQLTKIASELKTKIGSDVAIDAKIDSSLLGGLVIKIGSQMIDTSIKSRLNTLATAMKG